MNWASYLLSLCLHLAVFLLIMFWPSSPPVNLETPPVMISLVDGAPGGNRTPSSILGKMGKPTDGPKDVSPPAKKADAAAPERPEVKADPTADKARPVEAKPEPRVEHKPEPKPEVKPKPKPEPKDATPVADKKDKKKKEDKKKDDDRKPEKPRKDDKKKDDKKSTPKDDKKTDKKADKPSQGDPVAAAMKQARREATSRVESGDRGSSVEQALAQARRNAGGDGGGGGGEGDGPGGGGLNDVYMGQVMLAVRPNWSFTSATRLNLVCVVRVKVNLQGEVEKVDVTQSSGAPAGRGPSRRRRRNSTPSWTLSSPSMNSWAASRSVKAVVPGGTAALTSWGSCPPGPVPPIPPALRCAGSAACGLRRHAPVCPHGGHMKRTLSRPAALLSLLPVFLLCLAPLHARAAGAAAADVANGYAGEAMAKILANWAAPADRGKVRIVVRVDAEGKVERCGYLEKSASQALNDSVCSAVMKTADLGKPPYGMSQDVYLTFWQGGMADLSGISRRQAARKASGAGAPAAAAAPEGRSGPVTLDSKPATLTTPLKAQDAYGPGHAAYFRKLVRELRDATYIPAELAKGTYYATVRLELDATGKILNHSLLQSSGSELLDRYVRQGIRRAGKVSPPPAAVGRFVNVTLTLVR